MKFQHQAVIIGILLFGISALAETMPDHQRYQANDCFECHTPHFSGDKVSDHHGYDCLECHDFHGAFSNLSFIKNVIATPSGDRAVVFTSQTGANSFADGDAVYNGICEVCHTSTVYHRNDGSGLAHNPATDCAQCHDHDADFTPTGGTCVGCHATPRPVGSGYRRQVVENLGDGNGDFVRLSHHVTDGSSSEVVTDSDCLVCHDQSQHQSLTDGVTVLLNDPNGGAAITYDGSPQSLDPFCRACHDGTHSSPFSDGNAAPDHSTFDPVIHGSGKSCAECHGNGHGSSNLALVREIVTTPSSGDYPVVFTSRTGANSFADGDVVMDGICEVCHTTTNFHTNDGFGSPHNSGTDCSGCHSHNPGFQPEAGSCMGCHSFVMGPGRRQIVENGGDNGGDFVLSSHHVTNGTASEVVTDADCIVCHDQALHTTFGDGVSVLLNNPAGGASITYDGTTSSLQPFCTACHDGTHPAPFSDANPAPDHAAFDPLLHGGGRDCAECHGNGHGSTNLALINDQVETPNSGTKAVVFTSRTGANSFADGDANYNGICEVCHTTTTFHRNDTSGAHGHNAGNDCTACHTHDPAFQANAGDCLGCHNATQSGYRRQVVENAGDGGGDFVLPSHHVSDGSTNEVVTNADCVVCHDQSQHMSYSDGVSVGLKDPGTGSGMVYDGTTASLTPFCVDCHDGTVTGAPFSDGNTAPTPLTTWSTSAHASQGAECGDCHQNGHGGASPDMLSDTYIMTDNNRYQANDYALCWQCHSENTIVWGNNTFEDRHEKHVEGEDSPCILCHSPHGSYDAGEPGMINFTEAFARGMDIQFIDGYDHSTSFWVSGNTGFCYIACHGKDHTPKDYNRGTVFLAPDMTETSSGSDLFKMAVCYPSPSRGPITLVLEKADGADKTTSPITLRINVYDLRGRLVRNLDYEHGGADDATIFWDGRDGDGQLVRSGVYFFRIATPSGTRTIKTSVVR